MQYKVFKDGIQLSRLGMGNMRLPVQKDVEGEPIDYEKGKAIIDRAIKSGVNYFDTAYIYHGGKSEEFTGKALAEYPRDSYYVADKFNFQANPDYRAQFAEQLERLGMDYIDFYLLHGIQDNFINDILNCGCVEYFKELKAQGKIRYLGFSYHGSVDNLKRMLTVYPWDFVQIQLNYYDWEFGNQRAQYEILKEAGIPVMVMEPVHGGMLATLNEQAAAYLKEKDPEASLASWAMRWIKSLDGVQVVLSGMGTEEMMSDNVKTFSERPDVTETEKEILKQAAEMIRPKVALSCTGCRYCVPNCPQELNIPELLIMYNAYKPEHEVWRLSNIRGWQEEKQPSACLGCGACTAHCPQSLDIPSAMAEMAEALAK